MGAADFGKFSFALAFVFLFKPITDPGLHHYLTREIARKKELTSLFLSEATTWIVAGLPLVLLSIFVVVNLIHDNPDTLMTVYLVAVASYIKNVKHVQRSALIAWEYLGIDAISLALERFLLFVVGAWGLMHGLGLIPLCWIFVGVRLVDYIVFVVLLRVNVGPSGFSFDFKSIWKMVSAAWPIGAYYITLYLLRYVDTVMISAMRNDQEVGWYSASQKIYQGLLAVPLVVATVLMPRLSKFYKEDVPAFHDLLMRGIKYVFFLAALVGFNGLLFSGIIITTLFGNGYLEAVAVLNIFLLGVAFAFGTNFLVTAFIAMDKQKFILTTSVIALILNVVLNAIFISIWGFKGAAFATIIVELLFVITMLISLKCHSLKMDFWVLFGKTVLAFAVPAAFTVYVFPGLSLVGRALLMNVGFAFFIFVFKFFDQKELGHVRNSWRTLF